ncbi:hypothetical protein FA09DRAFT_343246 [Tilletiopsis washingtonensis]|uniref:Rad21/Rec8-like protein N-terminal domain-containing protein n=1 Tax=Tilletiopsis washingtonensis TaxID=58919 RepID=A0A316Z8R2_9BASI|nr:hypothetical protein FA09DRAFT_343246 [Tilletiopsis washingtonensis]PWN98177.1 hypothetical protein FA09DRAFT_343246 [Tilletiopsis washingtonensis]
MFYSDVILSKRGALGNIWLAAHWERRLSKAQLLRTSVEKGVEAIMTQQTAPMALRLTGQLLLGVVRIYSRKAKYLLDDCNEALVKIKVAFRSGAVDMTSDALHVPRSAITLGATLTDFDMGFPDAGLEDWDADGGAGRSGTPLRTGSASKRRAPDSSGNTHLARQQDITLNRIIDDGDAWDAAETGIASGDFEDGGLDLGLELDDDALAAREAGLLRGDEMEVDDSLSVGVGRDAAGSDVGGRSVGSLLGLGGEANDTGAGQRDSLGPMPDFDDGGFDFFGGDFDAPAAPASVAEDTIDMTPRTAAKIREAAERRALEEAKAQGGKGRKQIIDANIQLAGVSQQNASPQTLIEESYLPRSRAYLRLLTMNGDPARHLLGDKANASLDIFAGPIGLAPQLSSLFTFDAAVLRRRRGLDAEGERAAKRIRGSEELSEIGRRDVGAEQPGGLSGFGGLDDTWGDEGQDMMMDQEMPDFALGLEEDGLRRSTRKSRHADVAADDESETGRLPALSRLATPEDDDNEPAEDSLVGFSPNSQNPLAAFDARPADADKARAAQSGWSNNSIRALRVVRAQLDPAIAAELDDDELPAAGAGKTLSFEKVAAGASRRAAAGFFFELLVLGTKDLVMLEQQQPYEDIRVAAKPALWTLQSAPTPAAA